MNMFLLNVGICIYNENVNNMQGTKCNGRVNLVPYVNKLM